MASFANASFCNCIRLPDSHGSTQEKRNHRSGCPFDDLLLWENNLNLTVLLIALLFICLALREQTNQGVEDASVRPLSPIARVHGHALFQSISKWIVPSKRECTLASSCLRHVRRLVGWRKIASSLQVRKNCFPTSESYAHVVELSLFQLRVYYVREQSSIWENLG